MIFYCFVYNAASMDSVHSFEKTSSPSILKIRCPHCFQTFKSFKNEFEEEYPTFHCFFCQGKFWISPKVSNAEVVLGHPLSERSKPPLPATQDVSTKTCPQCSRKVPMTDKECIYCGVVFMRLIKKQQAYFQLKALWEKVLRKWQDENSHNEFLNACYDQNQLIYGIMCYGRILKEDRRNTKAKEIISRMKALRWSFATEPSIVSPRRWKRWLYRFGRKLRYRIWDVSALVFMCALIFFVMIF